MRDFYPRKLYYTPYVIAYFIVSQKMKIRKQVEVLEDLFQNECQYIHPDFKEDKKDFIEDVMFWTDYLVDRSNLDKEFPMIERDFDGLGGKFNREHLMSDYPEFDLFFMNLRLRLLYASDLKYIWMSLRSLLNHYGYKRRSYVIINHLKKCMSFYRIQPYFWGDRRCDIGNYQMVSLDDMIVFRLAE